MEPNATDKSSSTDDTQPLKQKSQEDQPNNSGTGTGGGGGWGWGFSPLSVLSDLQKAAEEISRNVILFPFPINMCLFPIALSNNLLLIE